MSEFFKGKSVVSSRRAGAEDFLKAFAKITKEQWKQATEQIKEYRGFLKEGGFGALMGGTIESVKQNTKTSVQGLFSPIENEINNFVANLVSETGLGNTINKIANSFGNLVNTLAAPDTGLGKAINFVGNAVANTLDFAAKGWQSLLSGRNAFAKEWEATILADTGGGRVMGGESILGGGFDIDLLEAQLA